MSDLVVALGLVLVIEGLLWALVAWPRPKLLEASAGTPESSLRMAGAWPSPSALPSSGSSAASRVPKESASASPDDLR